MPKTDSYLNSVNLNAGTDFPYLVLDVAGDRGYPRNPGFRVMHWHEDLQFIYVLEGDITIQTLDAKITLHEGEAVFINRDVVHLVMPGGPCHYNSFIFPDYFLKFYSESPAGILVDKIVGHPQIPVFAFKEKNAWCSRVLSTLQTLVSLENSKTEFYVYEVLLHLSSLWLEIQKNIFLCLKVPSVGRSGHVNTRMQSFLSYIEKHYAEEISLEALAKSGNVSKSECLRCFKLSLQTTPYKYLMEYRLSKAATLIKNTDEPIGNIASKVGFRHMSHFGKCFREKTGYAPRDYRDL